MAENTPSTPEGAAPPKPAESAAKVQPKKETVRISLPPKPTAAPTVRIPAPAAPSSSVASAAAPAAAAKGPAAPKPPTPPASAQASLKGGPAKPAQAPQAAAGPTPGAGMQKRPAMAPRVAPAAAAQVEKLDGALAIAAGVFALLALGYCLYMITFFN